MGKTGPSVDTRLEQGEDNDSVYSIEIVGDLVKDFRVPPKAKVSEADDNDSVYSIEVIEDINGDAPLPGVESEDPTVETTAEDKRVDLKPVVDVLGNNET